MAFTAITASTDAATIQEIARLGTLTNLQSNFEFLQVDKDYTVQLGYIAVSEWTGKATQMPKAPSWVPAALHPAAGQLLVLQWSTAGQPARTSGVGRLGGATTGDQLAQLLSGQPVSGKAKFETVTPEGKPSFKVWYLAK